MKPKNILLIFPSILLFYNCSQKKEEVDLKLVLQPNERYKIISETDAGMQGKMSIKNSMEFEFKVDSVDAKNHYYITTKVIRVKEESNMFGEKTSYDSSQDVATMNSDNQMLHREYVAYLNSDFNMVLSEKGEVIKEFSSTEKVPYENDILDLTNFQIKFPDQPVKVGSKWQHHGENKLTEQKIIMNYTVSQITEKEVTISVHKLIKGISGLMGDNNANGEYVLEKATGKLIKSHISMNLQTGGSAKYSFRRE